MTQGGDEMNREKVIDAFKERISSCSMIGDGFDVTLNWKLADDILALLKEQDELLKHEYWRCYNNGRADERGLQEGTIMQTFSPD